MNIQPQGRSVRAGPAPLGTLLGRWVPGAGGGLCSRCLSEVRFQGCPKGGGQLAGTRAGPDRQVGPHPLLHTEAEAETTRGPQISAQFVPLLGTVANFFMSLAEDQEAEMFLGTSSLRPNSSSPTTLPRPARHLIPGNTCRIPQ